MKRLKSSEAPVKLPASINPKWATHYQALCLERERLIEKSKNRLAEVEEPIPLSIDQAEIARDEDDGRLSCKILSTNERQLEEVEAAIRRIERGAYGICEATGAIIPMSRLAALPWCRYTLKAEMAIERDIANKTIK